MYTEYITCKSQRIYSIKYTLRLKLILQIGQTGQRIYKVFLQSMSIGCDKLANIIRSIRERLMIDMKTINF